MTISTVNLTVRHCGEGGRRASRDVAATTHLYKGTGVSCLDSGGDLVPTTTASSGHCIGVMSHEVDNTGAAGAAKGWYETDRVFLFTNDGTNPFDEATHEPGALAYATDDHTVATVGTVVMGQYRGVDSDGLVRVYVSPTIAAQADLDSRIASEVAPLYREVTIGHADLTTAGDTQTINVGAALPAGATILGVDFSNFTIFAGGTVSQLLLDIGSAGDVDAIRDGVDLDTTAVDGQPSAAPLGIAPNKHFASATQLIATVVATGDDLVNLTSGAITIRVFFTEV